MRRALLLMGLLGLSSCSGPGYLTRRAEDLADCFVLVGAVGPELSIDVQATDLLHVAVGGGLHGEAGLIGRRAGTAGVLTLGLPIAPFLEEGVLHGRYLFTETGGAWRSEDVEDECYLVHLADVAPTHPRSDPWHAFDLELGVTALVGVRLGFRPGELVDFLVGWFGFDPLHDDGGGDDGIRAED